MVEGLPREGGGEEPVEGTEVLGNVLPTRAQTHWPRGRKMALNPGEGESRGFRRVKSLSQGQQESAPGVQPV